MSPRLSSGEQEIPLWYISNAKASLRTHGSEVGPGQEHMLHSSGTQPSLPCTQEAPKTPASSPHFICCSSCSPVDVTWSLPSDTHTAAGPLGLGQPTRGQNSMWRLKSWESKSSKLRELPRMGEGSPQGLEEHLHPKRSGWSALPRVPHTHCHPTLARAGCEASQAKGFPLKLP